MTGGTHRAVVAGTGAALAACAGLSACAALGGDPGAGLAIEVVNDRPRVGFLDRDARISIVPVDEPERERLLGMVPRGERRLFRFEPREWARSYRLVAEGMQSTGPLELGPGMRVEWRLQFNDVRVTRPPSEAVAAAS